VSDIDPALFALTATTPPVVMLLRGADVQAPVPHLEWTIGDLAAHMVSIVRAYTAAAAGLSPVGPDVRTINENNARLIAETSESTASGLADALDVATADFVAGNGRLERSQPVPFYGDLTTSAGVQARLLLGDRLMHWWDLATTLGQRLSVDPEVVRLAIDGSFDALPDFVVPERAEGFTATFEFRIRGAPSRFLVFTDGVLTVRGDAPGRVDCRITADPMAYALFAFGRGPRWRPLFKREMVISGRRPWVANKLSAIIDAP
jgi:uncharacterized protein (TIGR03083 family)